LRDRADGHSVHHSDRANCRDFSGIQRQANGTRFSNSVSLFGLDIPRKESVCWVTHAERFIGLLLSPASASRPPRGCGGDGAMLRCHEGQEFFDVEPQRRATREGAIFFESPVKGSQQGST
jgi:hypothetical protein